MSTTDDTTAGEAVPDAPDPDEASDRAGATSGPSAAPGDTGGAPHRLRDLDRRGRLVAALCGLLLLVPVGASVGRALADGWIPSNDDALIVLQARDVLSTDPPLIGQPSTSELYADGLTARHPGAIEFYLLALPIRVLGPAVGTLLTAAALAGAAVLITAWIAFRRAGPAVALGATVLLSGAMWSSGLAVLSDPLSSNVGGYPLIAGTALAWALWCDDRRLWPLAVAVWSFTIQQHLAIFGIAGIVAAWGTAGAVVLTLTHRREVGRLASSARWAAVSVGVGVVCWLGPLVDQLFGTGNLGNIVELSSHSDRPTLGLGRGLRVGWNAMSAAPPLLTTRDVTDSELSGLDLLTPLSGGRAVAVGLGGILLLVATGVAYLGRRQPGGRSRLALAGTALVVLAGGVLTAANVPDSLEASRINFYRWMWSAAIAGWGTILWTAATTVRSLLPGERRRPAWLAPAGVGAVLLLVGGVALATATHDGFADQRRDEPLFAYEADAIDALTEVLPRDRPVRVLAPDIAAWISVAPAIVVGLEDAGYEVWVNPSQAGGYGDHRTRPPRDGESVVAVLSADGATSGADGERVARLELPRRPGEVTSVWGQDTFEVWADPAG